MPLKGGTMSGQTSSSDGLFIKKKALVKIKIEIIFKKSLTKKSLPVLTLKTKKEGRETRTTRIPSPLAQGFGWRTA